MKYHICSVMEWYCNGEKRIIFGGETSPEIIVAGILDGKKFNIRQIHMECLWQNFRIFRLVVRIVWK